MARRYLFGPVDATFADQNLHQARESGECLAFDCHPGSDLTIQHSDAWADVVARLPSGWQPDFVVLYLPYRTIPPCLWSAPLPIVGLGGDWTLLWHYYRHCLPACDLVLLDTVGVETMKRAGMSHGRLANIYGCERGYIESSASTGKRDIDVLFVGNFNPSIQCERLPWIARLATLAQRWRVFVTTNTFGADYRSLMKRARIVFNRSARRECNQRAFEATSSGALLFNEADNLEVPGYFEDRREYVAYTSDNLEPLLTYYLENEDERSEIADAGRRRVQKYSFAVLWQETLERIGDELSLLAAHKRTTPATSTDDLKRRLWQLTHSRAGSDLALAMTLKETVSANQDSAYLHHALAVAVVYAATPSAPADLSTVVNALQEALRHDPFHFLARITLVELLAQVGQTEAAIEHARKGLADLAKPCPLSSAVLDAPHVPPPFDTFRVEWERAAWANAGDAVGEEQAKRKLLNWQLHSLLADLTGELVYFEGAAAARPDLPGTQATLGWALTRVNRYSEAIPHLQRCVDDLPFDAQVATVLYESLGEAGEWPRQHRLAQRYFLLHQAAPDLVPERPWFTPPPSFYHPTAPPREVGSIVWEGGFEELHSFALVNRAVCSGLIERGYDVTLQPSEDARPLGPYLPLSEKLAMALRRPLSKPPSVHIRHQWPPCWDRPPHGRWVIIQPWEYGSLPLAWLEPMRDRVDEIWVPSSWVRACYIHSGIPAERVHVVPNGVDVALLQRRYPPFPLRTTKTFKFLFVGGTIYRKGIDALLQAYIATFNHADDVCLVIKDAGTGSHYQGQTAEKQIATLQTADAPEIEYLPRDVSTEEMAALYQSCTCLVHPYRGEGFGLPIAEAMACGLPVIVTGHGASLDFCDEKRTILPARLGRLPERSIGNLETVDYPWLAEPDQATLRSYLRQVVDHADEARAKGKAAADFIREHFSWDRAVDVVAARLEHLTGCRG